jgi:hypothetical protein
MNFFEPTTKHNVTSILDQNITGFSKESPIAAKTIKCFALITWNKEIQGS